MKRSIFVIIAVIVTLLFCACGCNKEAEQVVYNKTNSEDVNSNELIFTASFDNAKTTLDPENKVLWSAQDRISVNGIEFVITSGAETTVATFKKADPTAPNPTAPYVAVYPSESYLKDGGGDFAGINLPAKEPMQEVLIFLQIRCMQKRRQHIWSLIMYAVCSKLRSAALLMTRKSMRYAFLP